VIDGIGRYGVALSVTDDLEVHAAAVERLGYSAIWVAGGQLSTLEPLLRILRATTGVAAELGLPANAVYLARARVLAHLRAELAGLLD